MARIRSIKPEFFKSLTLRKLDKLTRLAFIGLWTYVDDNGVGIDEERLITAELWPLEDNPIEELEGVKSDMIDLARFGLIQRYSVGGRRLFFITNWDEHQKISHPAKPRHFRPMPGRGNPPGDRPTIVRHSPEGLPLFSGDSPEGLPGTKNEPASDDRLISEEQFGHEPVDPEETAGQNALLKPSGESPENFRSEQGSGIRDQGKEPCSSEMSAGASKRIKPTVKQSDFEAFWKSWPRRVGKIKAQAAFALAVKAGADPAAIIAACVSYAERHRRAGTPKDKIPHPTTWLNRGSWDDDLDDAVPLPGGATPQPVVDLPPHCGQCDPVDRTLLTLDNTLEPCPNCHPDRAGARR